MISAPEMCFGSTASGDSKWGCLYALCFPQILMSILIHHLVVLKHVIVQTVMGMHLEPDIDGISDNEDDRSNTGDHDDFVIELLLVD